MNPIAPVALAALALDQLSKLSIRHLLYLESAGPVDVLAPYLVFKAGWNPGINFGFLPFPQSVTPIVLILIAIAVCIGISLWARGKTSPVAQAGAGLLIGGALGNVVDRALHGAVFDFINMSCCGIQNTFIFNIADVAIFAGAAAVVLVSRERVKPAISSA